MKIRKNVENDILLKVGYWKNGDEDQVFLQNCVEVENEYANEWQGLINEVTKNQKNQEQRIKQEIKKYAKL